MFDRRSPFALAAAAFGHALLAAILASALAAQLTPDCGPAAGGRSSRDESLRDLACDAEDHPRNLDLRTEYGRRLALAHRYNDALNQFQYVLQRNPENARARLGVAKVMSWQSRFDVAEEMYDQLLHYNPGYYDALVGRAFNLLWMGEKSRAREALVECRAVHPDDAEVISALAALGVHGSPEEEAAGSGSTRHRRGAHARASARSEPAFPLEEPPVARTVHVPDLDDALAAVAPFKPLLLPAATGLVLFAGFFGIRSTIQWLRLPLIVAGLKAGRPPILLAPSSAEKPVRRDTVYQPKPRPPIEAEPVAAAPVTAASAAPLPKPAPAVDSAAVSDAPPPEVPKRILLAEDEQPVLDFVRETLEAAGVHVIACNRGADALEHLRDRSFDAVIADVALPGVPGNELYCWLAENQPGLEKRLMLALPQPADDTLQRFIDRTGVLCITRPFGVPDLVVMTRLLLERARLQAAAPN